MKILNSYGTTNVTQKQVYYHWACLNQEMWWLDDDQVRSAEMVLEWEAGKDVERIPISPEGRISCMAFAFCEVEQEYGTEIEEVSVDLTCKSLVQTCNVNNT